MESEAEGKSRLSVLCSSRVTDPAAQERQSRTGLEWNSSHWTDLPRNPHKGLACRIALAGLLVMNIISLGCRRAIISESRMGTVGRP